MWLCVVRDYFSRQGGRFLGGRYVLDLDWFALQRPVVVVQRVEAQVIAQGNEKFVRMMTHRLLI